MAKAASPNVFPLNLAFAGFGIARFRPPDHIPSCGRCCEEKISKLRKGTLADAPQLPGVYAMLDPLGRVMYVGKAKSLRHRLASYFRVKSRDRKAGRILKRTRAIAWEVATDEFAALLRELELIQRFRPRFNVVGQPGRKQYTYICVGKEKTTGVFISRNPTQDAKAVYGPFVSKPRAEKAVRRLNDRYQLRDCPATTPMQFRTSTSDTKLTPLCLRFDLGMCSAPCAAMCSERGYQKQIAGAIAFLNGSDRSLLDEVKAEMQTAAEAMHYERAAATRDKLAELQWLDERLSQLQKARERKTYLYPLLSHDGQTTWYRIDRGQIQSVHFGIADKPPEAIMVAIEPRLIISGRDVDSVLLVSAWFRKYASERNALQQIPSPTKMKQAV